MAKMGYQQGRGLGRDNQGIAAPIEPSVQTDTKGLGYSLGALDTDFQASFDEEVIHWDKKVEWLPSYEGPMPDEGALNDWMEYDTMKTDIDNETSFCDGPLLSEMLALKSNFDKLENRKLMEARSRANPYEALNRAIFQNRAALKMADMDYATGFIFSNPKNPDGKEVLPADQPDLLLFADICAGPGGFTEYLTWRRGWRCKGWGFTLRSPSDGSDFKLDKFLAGSTESFEPYYGVGAAEGDGDILKVDNITEFKRYVLQQTNSNGVHTVMADGGFSVAGQENIQEVLSKHLILSQILTAFSILAPGGNFLCKLFDCFTMGTVGLIYLCYICFEKIGIYKPITSRPANSERYIICQGFKGNQDCVMVADHLYSISEIMHTFQKEQDVTQLVPISQMDPSFVSYLTNSNNVILKEQISALKKVIQFVKNPNLVESRLKDIKDHYLDKWQVPKEPRKSKLLTEAANKFQQLCPGHVAPFSGEDNSVKITKDNLEEQMGGSLHELRFYFIGSSLNRELILSQGGTHVHKTPDLVKWARLEAPYTLELPRDTIIHAEFLHEHKGEGVRASTDKVLHITDVIMIGGQSLDNKPLKERLHWAEKLAQAVSKPSRAGLCRLRVKQLYRLESLEEVFTSQLAKRQMRQPSARLELCVTQPDDRYFECHGIRIVRILRSNYQMVISKSTRKFYFFDKRTGKSEFHCPQAALASFWDCFRNSIKWAREPGVKFAPIDEDHRSIDRVSCHDFVKYINKLKGENSLPGV